MKKINPIGATLLSIRGIILILKIKLIIEANPKKEKHPRAKNEDGTWTYIILTESP